MHRGCRREVKGDEGEWLLEPWGGWRELMGGLSEGLPMGGCREGYGGSICEGKGATPTKG